jgi:hypothetical protein
MPEEPGFSIAAQEPIDGKGCFPCDGVTTGGLETT